jgi:two-component system, OmpR family, phosphate regulon sensor histidine kinase PhoR
MTRIRGSTPAAATPATGPAHQPRAADTVARRVARTAIGMIIVLLIVGGAAIFALIRSAQSVDRLSNGYGPAADANADALTYMLDAETGIRGYALTGRAVTLEPYAMSIHRILPTITSIRTAMHRIGDDSLDAEIAVQYARARDWITTVAQPAVTSPAAARRATEAPGAKARFDRFRAVNGQIGASLDATRAQLQQDTEHQRTVVLPIVISGAVLALVLAGIVALRTARGVSRPLTALWQVVGRLENGDLSARADETWGPAEVREVAAAVNSLAVERRRVLAAQRADDLLRRETRELTSAIRIGQDPRAIARTLVPGLGRVYDVDRVWLYTFDDPRVPRLVEEWVRGGKLDDSDIDEDGLGQDALRGLARRLWHGSSVVGVIDHRHLPDTLDPHLGVAPQAEFARASAVAALGEGNTAFGLLWLAVADVPRQWTQAELGLLQHVAGELAQNLVQSHVLVRQREAMRLLREADEAKSALVSTVSHELRTPLTSIMGYLDVLLDMYRDDLPNDVTDMLRVIERNAVRLRSLIDDLLVQSQIEAGRRLVVLDRVDLAGVLTDVVETMAPLADSAGLALDFVQPAPGALLVNGDARQLGQAIGNLVSNAVKFTKRGGRVLISATSERQDVLVRVSDTGIGIPDAELPHLFDRFYRATNARSAVIPGTGLGLGIVAEIVNQHSGTVRVESELSVGTSFEIRLPLAADARISGATPAAEGAGTVEIG